MLWITNNQFNTDLHLTRAVSDAYFQDRNVKYFDNDGFELTALEQLYYEQHGIDIDTYALNHRADQRDWIVGGTDKFKVDHCLLLQRWDFQGEAREQLNYYKTYYPQLSKFLKIVPKWGIDFALDYYNGDMAIEVIHIETDYRTYDEAMEAKTLIERNIINTDWNDFVSKIIEQKEQWINLTGFAQNDWKAVYWGLNKAEVTQKAYTGH